MIKISLRCHKFGNTFTLNLRFPGQYFDSETDTHYNINRDYNPLTGRYVQSDPIGLEGGVNTYLYANANPLGYVDEEGLVGCSYSISNHLLYCISNDYSKEIYTFKVHSGNGKCKNNSSRSCQEKEDIGPVPVGTYNIFKNNNHKGWWALQDVNWIPKLSGLAHMFGFKRAGFNIHLGTYSQGCITIDKNDPEAVKFFKELNEMFINDQPNNVIKVIE